MSFQISLLLSSFQNSPICRENGKVGDISTTPGMRLPSPLSPLRNRSRFQLSHSHNPMPCFLRPSQTSSHTPFISFNFLHMLPIIHVRERELSRALGTLNASDVAVLVKLLVLADAGTGVVHIRSDDLATELAMNPSFIERALERLGEKEFLEELVSEGDVLFIELGSLLVRRGAAPSNIPLEKLI